MTQKNPWLSDSGQTADNPEDASNTSNPWSVDPGGDNPWGAKPETTAFPPVDANQSPATWDERGDFSHGIQDPRLASSPFQDDPDSHPDYGNSGAQPFQGPADQQVEAKRGGRWIIPVVIIIALIALIAGGVVIARQSGLLTFGTADTEEPVVVTEVVIAPEEADTQTGDEDAPPAEENGDTTPGEDVEQPTGAPLPDSGSARSGNPGSSFNNAYAGSSVTSQEFVQQVRMAFVDFYNSTGQTSGSITAYSPVTGLYYSMNCTDNGSVVTCRGGNNAVVHIS